MEARSENCYCFSSSAPWVAHAAFNARPQTCSDERVFFLAIFARCTYTYWNGTRLSSHFSCYLFPRRRKIWWCIFMIPLLFDSNPSASCAINPQTEHYLAMHICDSDWARVGREFHSTSLFRVFCFTKTFATEQKPFAFRYFHATPLCSTPY